MEKFYVYTCCEYFAKDNDIKDRVVVYKNENDAKRAVDYVYYFYNKKEMIDSLDQFALGYGYIMRLNNGNIIKVRCYEDDAE